MVKPTVKEPLDLKEVVSKYKISIASLVVLIPALVGAMSFVDSRYAQAKEVNDVKNAQLQLQQNMDRRYVQIRQGQLEDAIFVLQMKKGQQGGKLTPLDGALLDRYQNQLNDLKNEK